MSKFGLYITALCLIAADGMAQGNKQVLSHIPKTGKTIMAFVPRGYDTMRTATGDLDKDGRDDAVLVLRDKREDTAADGNPILDHSRLLVVLFKTDAGWELAATGGEVVMCKQCGGVFGDPFSDVVIHKGILVVDHYGGSNWRWTYSTKFRYQEGSFCLAGQTRNSFFNVGDCDKLGDAPGTDFEDINFVTGDRERKKISQECKLLLHKKDKIKVKPLVKLADYKIEN